MNKIKHNIVIINIKGAVKMDKLTELIKEAKPLYKKRKRQKALLKTLFMISMPVMLFYGMFELYSEGNNIYLSLKNNILQKELLNDDYYNFLRY